MQANLKNSAVATALEKISFLLGASMGNPAHGKGHEEGGLTNAKEGSGLRVAPGLSRASTPKIRVCLLYHSTLSLCFPPTLLTLTGGCPPTTFF